MVDGLPQDRPYSMEPADKMHRLFADHYVWSEKTFGKFRIRKAKGALKGIASHLRAETYEVEAAKPQDQLEEVADVFILLFDMCHLLGITYQDALTAIAFKQRKNGRRDWPVLKDQDPTKPINHKK